MSFSVRVAGDVVSVEAGATVPLGIEIANRSDEADHFEMEVEGLDPDWTAVPVPTFAIDPRDIQTEKIFFKPPRVSESLAGTFPFVVKVRSLLTGEQRTAQGILEIKPYHHLTMELSPKKGTYSATKKANEFHATVMNLGNIEHTLQFAATDPEDALAYDFEQDQVSLAPGQTKTIRVTAKPSESRTFAGSRLHGFSITARSIEVPSVVCSAQAQLEERPLLSPSTLIFAILVLVLAVAWWAVRPQPPRMDSLSVQPSEAVRGQEVVVKWAASNATSVQLKVLSRTLDAVKPNDEYRFTATESGYIEAVAIRESKASGTRMVYLTVTDPPAIPAPKIERFEITPKKVKLGESLLVRYKLSGGVADARLEPTGQVLDPNLEQLQIKADLPGEVTYSLVARNSEGKSVRRSVKVEVVEGSDASIVIFKAEPMSLPPAGGRVTISWQLSKAERIELQAGPEQLVLDSPAGTRDFLIDQSTDFTITGYDSQGRTVIKKIRVEVEPPPQIEPPPTTTGGTIPPGGFGLR